MATRPVQHMSALILGTVMLAAIYILPREIITPLIVASLILFHLALISALWGFTAGILCSLAAFVCFNYFFIEPYYKFSISGFSDIAVFFVFVLVTAVMSQSLASNRVLTLSHQDARLIRTIVGNLPRPESIGKPSLNGKQLAQLVRNMTREHFIEDRLLAIDVPEELPPLRLGMAQVAPILTGLISYVRKHSSKGRQIYLRAWRLEQAIYVQVCNQALLLPTEESGNSLEETGFCACVDRLTEPELSSFQDIIVTHGGYFWINKLGDRIALNFRLPSL